MQANSTIEDIVNEIKRFRILCVGRAGVGKSSLINRVFGLQEAPVEQWKVGHADIEKEFTSPENQFFVLHDSKGFEAGDAQNFDIVKKFMNERREKSRLEDRLHAVWLCTETPIAGGRVLETGDEKLLLLAHETNTPVVVVFTKYDRLVRSKGIELKPEGDQNSPVSGDTVKAEAQKVLDNCMQSLESAERRLKIQKLHHAKVSIHPGHEDDLSSLVQVTRGVVHETLKSIAQLNSGNEAYVSSPGQVPRGVVHETVILAVAQRADSQIKIETFIESAGTGHYKRLFGRIRLEVTLLDWLADIHRDLVTVWNFKDEDKILSNDVFKQLIQYLVQDIVESLDQVDSHYTSSPALVIDKISQFLDQIPTSPTTLSPLETTGHFAVWLKDTAVYNAPKTRLLLTTYIVDLTSVLKSLFEITLQRAQSPRSITWLDLKDAFKNFDESGSRKRIHDRIYAVAQDQQTLDSKGFRDMFFELVNDTKDAKGTASKPGTTSVTGTASVQGTSQVTQKPAPVATSSRAPEDALEPRRLRKRLPCLCY